MSFRKFGGLNYNAKNNIVKNHYGISDNFQSTETIGQNNSKMVCLSDIDMSDNSIMNVNELYFYDFKTPQTQPFIYSDISGAFAPIINPSGGIHNYAPLTNANFLTLISVSGDVSANSFNKIPIGYGHNDISNNISIGYQALQSNTVIGSYNTSIGYQALQSNTDGSNNIAIGYQALKSNTIGLSNIAIGNQSLNNNTQSGNVAIGINTLQSNTSGYNNTAIGSNALKLNTTGYNNTAIGSNSFLTNTSGNNNTIIGFGADILGSSFSNSTAIGYNSKATGSNQIMLGTSSEIVYCPSGILISGNAQATTFTTTSDYRIKENVENIDINKYNIDKLRPVTYTNKLTNAQDFGLIAHEIQSEFPSLVSGEKNGETNQSVNYMGLIAILIKEIQELKDEVKLLKQVLL